MKKQLQHIILLLGLLTLTACLGEGSNRSFQLPSGLYVWHTATGDEAIIIEELIARFQTINPNVTIVSEYVPSENLTEEFVAQSSAGLGPDVIVGLENHRLPELIATDLLLELTEYEFDHTQLFDNVTNALMVDTELYALPFSAQTTILYYNRDLTQTPASNLDDLFTEAQAGLQVAIPTSFNQAFWGVRAFGGHVLDENGRVIESEGFSQWLSWLDSTQKEPNIILNDNYTDLLNLFLEGKAAYFIGSSADLKEIQTTLGADSVGIRTLPEQAPPEIEAEPEEEEQSAVEEVLELETEEEVINEEPIEDIRPGSFLELEVIAISRVSAEKELSLELATFLTNPTQQRRLALSGLGLISLNNRLAFDARVFPIASILSRQRAQAVIVPLAALRTQQAVETVGNVIYLEVLEGVLTPEEAAERLRLETNGLLVEQINAENGSP